MPKKKNSISRTAKIDLVKIYPSVVSKVVISEKDLNTIDRFIENAVNTLMSIPGIDKLAVKYGYDTYTYSAMNLIFPILLPYENKNTGFVSNLEFMVGYDFNESQAISAVENNSFKGDPLITEFVRIVKDNADFLEINHDDIFDKLCTGQSSEAISKFISECHLISETFDTGDIDSLVQEKIAEGIFTRLKTLLKATPAIDYRNL